MAIALAAGAATWMFTPRGAAWREQILATLGGSREPDAQRVQAVSQSLSAATPEELERAEKNVRAVHERMNQIAGWGHLSLLRDRQSPAWDEVRQVLEGGTLRFLRDVAPRLTPASVGRDLQAFAKALEEGYARRDADRVRVAHRIIHDLDYFVFNHETVPGGDRHYWGATITLEGEDALAQEVLGPPAETGAPEGGRP
ncbi:MAG TPA: hypothetical protein VIL40_01170 [Thermaerobacter sp.]